MAPNLTTEVANTAHEQWLTNEFQDMTSMPGFNNGDFHFWKGTVYDTFQLQRPKSTSVRPSKDVGIRYATNPTPSLVILSCLEEDYTQTYDEMTLWMENGQGKVQAAILFCYTVAMKPDAKKSYVADEGDSPASLRCVVRLFEYDGGVNNCCRQAMVTGLTPSQLEDICDDDFPPLAFTLQQLRGGSPQQVGEDNVGLDHDFSLMNLWTLAYGIFGQDIDEHEIDLQGYLESPPMSAVLEKGTYDFFGVPSPPASDDDGDSSLEEDEEGAEGGDDDTDGGGDNHNANGLTASDYSEGRALGESQEDEGEGGEDGEEQEEQVTEGNDNRAEVGRPRVRRHHHRPGPTLQVTKSSNYRTHIPSPASEPQQITPPRSARRVRGYQGLQLTGMPPLRGRRGTVRAEYEEDEEDEVEGGEWEEEEELEEEDEQDEQLEEDDGDETEVDEPRRRRSPAGLQISMVPFPIYRTQEASIAASGHRHITPPRSTQRVRDSHQIMRLETPGSGGGFSRVGKDASSKSLSQTIITDTRNQVLQSQSSPESRHSSPLGFTAFPARDSPAPPHDANCPYCSTSLRVVGICEMLGYTVHISRPAGEKLNAYDNARLESRKRKMIEGFEKVMRDIEQEEMIMQGSEQEGMIVQGSGEKEITSEDDDDAVKIHPQVDMEIGLDSIHKHDITSEVAGTRPAPAPGGQSTTYKQHRVRVTRGGRLQGGARPEIDNSGGANQVTGGDSIHFPNEVPDIITVPPSLGTKPPRTKPGTKKPSKKPGTEKLGTKQNDVLEKDVTTAEEQPPGHDSTTHTTIDIYTDKLHKKPPAGPSANDVSGSPESSPTTGGEAVQQVSNDIQYTYEMDKPVLPQSPLQGPDTGRATPSRSRTRDRPMRRPLAPSKVNVTPTPRPRKSTGTPSGTKVDEEQVEEVQVDEEQVDDQEQVREQAGVDNATQIHIKLNGPTRRPLRPRKPKGAPSGTKVDEEQVEEIQVEEVKVDEEQVDEEHLSEGHSYEVQAGVDSATQIHTKLNGTTRRPLRPRKPKGAPSGTKVDEEQVDEEHLSEGQVGDEQVGEEQVDDQEHLSEGHSYEAQAGVDSAIQIHTKLNGPTRRPLHPRKPKGTPSDTKVNEKQIGGGRIDEGQMGVGGAPSPNFDTQELSNSDVHQHWHKSTGTAGSQSSAGAQQKDATFESHEALLEQLQTLLLKLHKGGSGVTMLPNLQLQVACEEAEVERVEMEMTLMVKVRGTNEMIHMAGGACQMTRQLVGVPGRCSMK